MDDRGFMVSLTPSAVSIGAGETQEVSVVLHPGTDSAPNALGNYATVTGTVVAERRSGPPPPPPDAVTPIPAHDAKGLLLLMGLLAGLALWQIRRLKQGKR